MKDSIQLELTIGGEKAGKTLKELRNDVKILSKELLTLPTGTEAFNKKAEELRNARAKLNEVEKAVKGVSDEMKKADSGFANFTSGVGESLSSLIPIGAAAMGVFAADKLFAFGQEAVNAFREAENATFQMYNAMVTLGGETEDTFNTLMEQADTLEQTTYGFTAEQIQEAQKTLKIFNLTGEEIERLIPKIVDYAAVTGKDLASATDDVKNAMLGKDKALKQVGITLDKADLTVQKITDSLSKFEGTAAQGLSVADNRFEVFSDKIGQYAERIGGALVRAGVRFAEIFGIIKESDITPQIESQTEAIMREQQELNVLVGAVMNVNTNQKARSALISELNEKYPGFLKGLDTEKVTNEQLAARLSDVNVQYEKKIRIVAAEELLKESLKKELELKQQLLSADIQLAKVQSEAAQKQIQTTEFISSQQLQYEQNRLNAAVNVNAAMKASGEEQLASLNENIAIQRKLLEEAKKEAQGIESWIGKATAKPIADRKMKPEDDEIEKTVKKEKEAAETRVKIREKEVEKVIKDLKALHAQEIEMAEAADEKILEAERKKNEAILEEQKKKEAATQELANRAMIAQADMQLLLAGKNEEAILQARIARIVTGRDIELQNEVLTAEERKLIVIQAEIDIAAAQESFRQAKLSAETAQHELMKEQQAAMIDLGMQGLAALNEFSSIIAEKNIKDAEKVKDARIKKLDEEKKRGKISEERYAREKEAIESETNAKIAKLKTEQAKKDKALAIVQSIINTALAVTAALTKDPTGIMATIVGISGAIQTGIIAAKPIPEFQKGGTFKTYANGGYTSGPSHANGGINLINSLTGEKVGEMEGGEMYHIYSRNTVKNNRHIMDALLYSSTQKNGAPIFQAGGAISTTPVTRLEGVQAQGSINIIDFSAVVERLDILTEEVRNQKTELEAFIRYEALEDSLTDVSAIRKKAGIR